jgi:hypothetical protein
MAPDRLSRIRSLLTEAELVDGITDRLERRFRGRVGTGQIGQL